MLRMAMRSMGLGLEDFELSDNGRRQEVQRLEAIDLEGAVPRLVVTFTPDRAQVAR